MGEGQRLRLRIGCRGRVSWKRWLLPLYPLRCAYPLLHLRLTGVLSYINILPLRTRRIPIGTRRERRTNVPLHSPNSLPTTDLAYTTAPPTPKKKAKHTRSLAALQRQRLLMTPTPLLLLLLLIQALLRLFVKTLTLCPLHLLPAPLGLCSQKGPYYPI